MSPRQFMHSMSKMDARWGDGSQQDSQEFMHALLEALQTETNRAATKPQVCVGGDAALAAGVHRRVSPRVP